MRKPDHWTVQVVPAGGGDVRSHRVGRRAVHLAIASFLLFVTLFLTSLFGFLGRAHSADEVARLRAENRQLATGLATMEEQTAELARTMDDLAARDQRFRLLAGLPLVEPEVYAAGVGGPGTLPSESPAFYRLDRRPASLARATMLDLEQLLRRARILAASLAEATDSVASNRETFLARPSIRPVPVEGAWISSGFSHSRLHPLLGYRRPHNAIDISAPPGSPVVATARGRVTFVGLQPGYGRLVEIDHGFGYRTRYAHLSSILVRPGHRVERADVIGEVGRSGLATGPNLHYEVLVGERAVNPAEYLLDELFLD